MEIFYTKDLTLTDEDIISFWQMIFAPEQMDWDYDDNRSMALMTESEILLFFRNTIIKRDNNHAFWARDNSHIIGMAAINCFTDSSKRHCAELGFSVQTAYQRRGIGYQLVCAVIHKARNLGIKRLESSCFANNVPAKCLLVKAGFNLEGTQIGAIQKQGQLRNICLFGLLF